MRAQSGGTGRGQGKCCLKCIYYLKSQQQAGTESVPAQNLPESFTFEIQSGCDGKHKLHSQCTTRYYRLSVGGSRKDSSEHCDGIISPSKDGQQQRLFASNCNLCRFPCTSPCVQSFAIQQRGIASQSISSWKGQWTQRQEIYQVGQLIASVYREACSNWLHGS